MGWLWPDITDDGRVVSRLGHVLFWLGAGISGLFAIGGVWTGLTGDDAKLAGVIICAIFAAVFYLIGRGLCYIFSGD